ncbi:MAG: sigma-70 family RNA polymerase sigma factor [Bacteroidota bacterium]|nr:sigma-70 family RNA polymerase sigma factor [Bacteroidota bacterium]
MKPSLSFLNTDSKIIDLIRRGDEEALVQLYQANRRSVTSFIVRNKGTEEDAKDMLQDSVIILWERIRSGRFEYRAKLSTFILGTVKNLWLRRLARQRREMPSEIDPETTSSDRTSALDDLIESEKAEQISRALKKIGQPCRQILVLFYWEELSMNEIAAKLGFANAETVKSKKYQCKKLLEQMLEKND